MGSGPGKTVIVADNKQSTIEVESPGEVHLQNLAIRGETLASDHNFAFPYDGGGLSVRNGSVILRNVEIRGACASRGGAIYVHRGKLLVEDSLIAENWGNMPGGIGGSNESEVAVVRTRFEDNIGTALGLGSRIAILEDVEFRGNRLQPIRPGDRADLIMFGPGQLTARRVKFEAGGYVEAFDPMREVRLEDTHWIGPYPDHVTIVEPKP